MAGIKWAREMEEQRAWRKCTGRVGRTWTFTPRQVRPWRAKDRGGAGLALLWMLQGGQTVAVSLGV